MKGTPPFTRHPVEQEFLARSWAGHSLQIRNAHLLFESGPFRVLEASQAVWLLVDCGTGVLAALRLLEKDPHVSKVKVAGEMPTLTLRTACLLGDYEVRLSLADVPVPMARATVAIRTRSPVRLENNQREVLLTNLKHEPLNDGLLFTAQTGSTAGHAFVAANGTSLFYFQNLSALGPYTSHTGAKLQSCVGMEWPAIGLSLPPGDSPLPKGAKVTISDAFLRVTGHGDRGEAARALEFMEGLSWVYRKTAPAPGQWFDWAGIARRTLDSLRKSRHCIRKVQGRTFLNAYVGSDDKPPESMVQGALEVPMVEYEEWLLSPHPLMQRLAGNLSMFFIKDLSTMARWLPGERFEMAERSEEEQAERMDSWYLMHTMMNLGRLAELGKQPEKRLFLDSLEYLIRVAAHFDHDWPVFYHRKMLQVLKREVKEGLGGERDAAGLYAHVMLQAWMLTSDRRYLDQAEEAASKLTGLGFGMLYQTNNTMFTGVALARLWKATGNSLYRELSFVCLGSVLSHLWMWEPSRPGNPWSTFMGLPPLHDAPYVAPYEEAEILAASRAYIDEMGEELPGAILDLLVEYGKHLAGRARYYFPSELPPSGVCQEPREGVIVRSLPVPLEDLYASMAPAGQVGQEVYGAALALVLTTRMFYRWKKVPFVIWAAVPLSCAEYSAEGTRAAEITVRFKVVGSEVRRHELRILPAARTKRKGTFKVWRTEPGKRRFLLRPALTDQRHLAFEAIGGADIEIIWVSK